MTDTCQHERWYKLPSGLNGFVICKEPATQRQYPELGFMMIEWLCPKHHGNTEPFVDKADR